MKIGGQEIGGDIAGLARVPRPNGNDLAVKVRAMPLGYDVDDRFPFPDPPKIKARRTNGQIERDKEGRIQWDLDVRDARYCAKRDELFKIRLMANLAAAVVQGQGKNEIEFQTDLKNDDEACYLALWEEVVASRFSTGDVMIVISKSLELSNLTAEAREKSLADFSQDDESQKASAGASTQG